jgi:hypothetical protein
MATFNAGFVTFSFESPLTSAFYLINAHYQTIIANVNSYLTIS